MNRLVLASFVLGCVLGCKGKEAAPASSRPAPATRPADAAPPDVTLPTIDGATQVLGRPLMCGGPCSLSKDYAGPRLLSDPEAVKKLVGDPQLDFSRQVIAIVDEGPYQAGTRSVVSWWRRGDTLIADALVTPDCSEEGKIGRGMLPSVFIVEAAGATTLEVRDREGPRPPGCP